ncbi:hypothetical protein HDV05_005916, partial [Chytridiales sp. JEL 0842]
MSFFSNVATASIADSDNHFGKVFKKDIISNLQVYRTHRRDYTTSPTYNYFVNTVLSNYNANKDYNAVIRDIPILLDVVANKTEPTDLVTALRTGLISLLNNIFVRDALPVDLNSAGFFFAETLLKLTENAALDPPEKTMVIDIVYYMMKIAFTSAKSTIDCMDLRFSGNVLQTLSDFWDDVSATSDYAADVVTWVEDLKINYETCTHNTGIYKDADQAMKTLSALADIVSNPNIKADVAYALRNGIITLIQQIVGKDELYIDLTSAGPSFIETIRKTTQDAADKLSPRIRDAVTSVISIIFDRVVKAVRSTGECLNLNLAGNFIQTFSYFWDDITADSDYLASINSWFERLKTSYETCVHQTGMYQTFDQARRDINVLLGVILSPSTKQELASALRTGLVTFVKQIVGANSLNIDPATTGREIADILTKIVDKANLSPALRNTAFTVLFDIIKELSKAAEQLGNCLDNEFAEKAIGALSNLLEAMTAEPNFDAALQAGFDSLKRDYEACRSHKTTIDAYPTLLTSAMAPTTVTMASTTTTITAVITGTTTAKTMETATTNEPTTTTTEAETISTGTTTTDEPTTATTEAETTETTSTESTATTADSTTTTTALIDETTTTTTSAATTTTTTTTTASIVFATPTSCPQGQILSCGRCSFTSTTDCRGSCPNPTDTIRYITDCTKSCVDSTIAAKLDACGVCNGNNSTCTDCAGVVRGTAKLDNCNVCNGDGSTCGTTITEVSPNVIINSGKSFVDVRGAGLLATLNLMSITFGTVTLQTSNITQQNNQGVRLALPKLESALSDGVNHVSVKLTFSWASPSTLSPVEFDITVVRDTTTISSVSGDTFYTGATTDADLTFTGTNFFANVPNAQPKCVFSTRPPFMSDLVIASATSASCQLPKPIEAGEVNVLLSYKLHSGNFKITPDTAIPTSDGNNVTLVFKAQAPQITSAKFSDNGAQIVITFDTSVRTSPASNLGAM